MTMIDRAMHTAKNVAKATIRRPRGFDLVHDLLQVIEPHIVFDVGANVGQSALKYLRRFPQATVYSFEPSVDNFALLLRFVPKSPRFKPVRLAFGSTSRKGRLDTASASSDMFQISESGDETITISTLDEFCANERVDRIDFMKIDTEGHDLEVLRGATRMLAEKRVGAIQVEAGMNPRNERHVPLHAFCDLLDQHGYGLFGVYDQVEEFFTGEMHMRRANPVFIPYGVKSVQAHA